MGPTIGADWRANKRHKKAYGKYRQLSTPKSSFFVDSSDQPAPQPAPHISNIVKSKRTPIDQQSERYNRRRTISAPMISERYNTIRAIRGGGHARSGGGGGGGGGHARSGGGGGGRRWKWAWSIPPIRSFKKKSAPLKLGPHSTASTLSLTIFTSPVLSVIV
jgi:hypothetical protein